MINTNDLRNICVVSHPNAGKTSLVEAMLNKAGLLERMGKVEDGNTVSDYDPEEIKRGISVNTSVIPIDWNGKKINLLDTPGTADFVGEQIQAASVCGSVLVVVSGADKADIVEKAFFGAITPQVPASILQLHEDVVVVGDEAAFAKIASRI